jgi:hypothetical protein
MNIYIMSRGRAGKVSTLKWIPKAWRNRVVLVVPRAEVLDYYEKDLGGIRYDGTGPQVLFGPETVTNYSQKFQWILDGLPGRLDYEKHKQDKAVIIDDDLVFSSRSDPLAPNSLISIKDPEATVDMWAGIETLLEEYALVGVHPRQMGQHAARPYVLNGRIICLQGVNRSKIGHVKVDQFPILADVVLNCTILARGRANAILTTFFQDHGPCQANGGCSIYRTHEMQREAVTYLATRFPGFVKVVPRKTKDKWLANEQGVRYDYTCQWKQLYAAGRAHVLDPGKVPNPDKEAAGASQAVE